MTDRIEAIFKIFSLGLIILPSAMLLVIPFAIIIAAIQAANKTVDYLTKGTK